MVKLDEFQTLYILTCQMVYGKIRLLGKAPEDAQKFLADFYVKVYEGSGFIPAEEERQESWAEEHICDMLDDEEREKALELFRLKNEPAEQEKPSEEQILEDISKDKISEEKITTLWLEIEERIANDPARQQTPLADRRFYSVFKIVMAAGAVLLTVFLFVSGYSRVHEYREQQRAEAAAESSRAAERESLEAEQELIRIEKESQEVGWDCDEDGNLFYINKEKEKASGALALGSQVYVFSHDGILTSIEEGSGIYNEDVTYFIDNKDVYMKAPGQEKVCVILNGHVEKMDIFDQSIYYICTYQIPNSEKVKTAVWRADLDGQNEEQVFETMSSLKTEHFQVSGSWYYYISDEKLLRMNWKNGKTELMCEGAEQYFVWDDIVYYMDDGVIATVSEGEPYQDLASYSLEADGDTFILKDASGEPVEADENGLLQIEDRVFELEDGRILSVSQGPQEFNGNHYFLKDGKIYWSESEGSGTMLRQSGERTDSFCIVGQTLYYSAYMGTNEIGLGTSRIYRIDLETMEEETASQTFEGRVTALWFSAEDDCVYGEHGAENGQPVRGRIVCIPENGGIYAIDDTDSRPQGVRGGSEWMRFLTSDGGNIYCLWQDCAGNPVSGNAGGLSTEPVILEREKIIYLH